MSETNKVYFKDFIKNPRTIKLRNSDNYKFLDKNFKLILNDKNDHTLRHSDLDRTLRGRYKNKPYITAHDFIYDPYKKNAKTQNNIELLSNIDSTYNKTLNLMRGDNNSYPENYYSRDGMIYLDKSFSDKLKIKDDDDIVIDDIENFVEGVVGNGIIINAGMYNVFDKLVELWNLQTKDPEIVETKDLPLIDPNDDPDDPDSEKYENKPYNEVFHIRNLFDISELADLTSIVRPQKRNLYNFLKTDLIKEEDGEYKSPISNSFGSNLLDTNFASNPHMAAMGKTLTVEKFNNMDIIRLGSNGSSVIKAPYLYMISEITLNQNNVPNIYIIIRNVPFKMRCNIMSNHVAIYSWSEYLLKTKEFINSIDYLHIDTLNISNFVFYVGNNVSYEVNGENSELENILHVFNNITHEELINNITHEELI